MRVIIQGQLPQDKPYVGTCENCGTVTAALLHELNKTFFGFFFAKCPFCMYVTYFEPTENLK